jgi:outer membrane murein-binding lipoprotein Lpp
MKKEQKDEPTKRITEFEEKLSQINSLIKDLSLKQKEMNAKISSINENLNRLSNIANMENQRLDKIEKKLTKKKR